MNNAGFGIRLLAILIDGLFLGLINLVIGFILDYLTQDENIFISSAFGFFIYFVYFVFYQTSDGQTLGKKALNIKVVDEQGKTPTPFVFLLREIIGKFVSAIILFIGYFIMLGDSKKQTLHDKIAGTYVVKV